TNAHAYQCYSLILLKATTKAVAYTLSLHDALPILSKVNVPDFPSSVVKVPSNSRVWILDRARPPPAALTFCSTILAGTWAPTGRSEEHTSELQSRFDLVCRLLLEKKKTTEKHTHEQ